MRTVKGLVVGLMLMFVVGVSRVEAASISLFFNGAYVDTGTEGANLQAQLVGLGHTVNTFTGITAADFIAAGAGSIIVFPEMEIADLASDLDAAAIAALQAYVSGGGTMIQANYFFGSSSLPNTLFGYSVVQAGSIGDTNLNPGDAAGTPFAGGPAVLPGLNAVEGVVTASLPIGALNLYSDGVNTSVFMTTYGAGHYIYLGYDWFEGLSSDWAFQTGAAVSTSAAAVPEPSTLLLLMTGLAFVGSRLRRRRNP